MSAAHPLDNPIWAALESEHASFAARARHAARYPADVAPFVAVDSTRREAAEQLESLVPEGESVYLLGLSPPLEGPDWRVGPAVRLPQLVCRSLARVNPGPEPVELSGAHRADMLALTALVFPGFFRPRTLEMGRYIGVYHGSVLAAMAGERMRIRGYQEISAVCTHPDFLGRGYAHRLVALLTNASLERGQIPFLHVYRENVRAISVYEHLGYAVRAELPFWSVARVS